MATIHHVAIKCLPSSKKHRVCSLDDWSQRRKGGGGVVGRWRGQRRRTNEQNSSTKPWQRGRHVFVMRLSPCLGLTLIGDVSYIQRQMISVWEARKGRNRSCEKEGDDLVGEATAAAWVGNQTWERQLGRSEDLKITFLSINALPCTVKGYLGTSPSVSFVHWVTFSGVKCAIYYFQELFTFRHFQPEHAKTAWYIDDVCHCEIHLAGKQLKFNFWNFGDRVK